MKKISALIIIVVVIVVISFFGNNKQSDSKLIKVGVLVPTSGIVADYGEEIKRGIMAANNEGIELIVEDEACEAKTALGAYKKLVEVNRVQFIVGPGCGASQEIIAPLVANDKMLVVVPSAATRTLHGISNKKMFFTQYTLEDESKFIADSMYGFGYKKVILISFQNAFSDIHVKNFKENFKGEIVSELSFMNGATDTASELVKIRNIEADAIFSTDIAFLYAQGASRLKQYGINIPVFSQYATELPAVRDLVVDNMIYSFPDNIGEQGAVFELSKLSAESMFNAIRACNGDFECTKKKFENPDEYNEFGVRKQNIILKQISGGKAHMLEVPGN